jgi:hypothetical protein
MMKKYQVLMDVRGIVLLLEGKPKLVGYYQTFKIEAESPEQAELIAVEKIRNDEEIKSLWIKDEQKKPPSIFAEDIYEVDEFDNTIVTDRTGRTLYPAKKWWQFWK